MRFNDFSRLWLQNAAERMDPSPRSLAAEANYCFMVGISRSNRIQVCGAIDCAQWQAPPGSFVVHQPDRRLPVAVRGTAQKICSRAGRMLAERIEQMNGRRKKRKI